MLESLIVLLQFCGVIGTDLCEQISQGCGLYLLYLSPQSTLIITDPFQATGHYVFLLTFVLAFPPGPHVSTHTARWL